MNVCRHFALCGGCQLQDISYKQQLKDKQAGVQQLMEKFGINAKLRKINHGKSWYYRNKMEFTFADKRGVVCGLYSKQKQDGIIGLTECLIFSVDAGKIIKCVEQFVNVKEYSAYNKYTYTGFLRNLIIRETKFTQEIMIGITTTGKAELDKQEFVKRLKSLKLKSRIKSIYWIVNNSFSDAVVFERKELLFGKRFIQEKLGKFKFNIGIDTFFQVNPKMAIKFYRKIKDYARLSGKQRVLDLFCGAGGIGMFLAQKAKSVFGVEISPEIIQMAEQNTKNNNIKNITFVAAEARRFLNTQGNPYKGIDLLVVNPPRCGLSNRILRAILRLKPKKIFYSSCNPESLMGNLSQLQGNYQVEFIEPFDFFPHTKHLECFSVLHRKTFQDKEIGKDDLS